MLVLSSVLVLRNAAHPTPPPSCWWSACSTRIILTSSSLHGYCVVYGMFFLLKTSLPWRPGILTPHVRCRSPRFTLTSKGPLNYMTEPLRTIHFILLALTPCILFSSKWFQILQMVQVFQNINVCPHRHGIEFKLLSPFSTFISIFVYVLVGRTYTSVPIIRGSMSS